MPPSVVTWTKVTDPDLAVTLLPPWFAGRMLASHGSFGLLLTTGDVMRVRWMTAVHISSAGAILLDVLLDVAGVPSGVDLAWQTKHYLGAPVPGAHMATINAASVVAVVEFVAAELAETNQDQVGGLPDEMAPPTTADLEAVAREVPADA